MRACAVETLATGDWRVWVFGRAMVGVRTSYVAVRRCAAIGVRRSLMAWAGDSVCGAASSRACGRLRSALRSHALVGWLPAARVLGAMTMAPVCHDGGGLWGIVRPRSSRSANRAGGRIKAVHPGGKIG